MARPRTAVRAGRLRTVSGVVVGVLTGGVLASGIAYAAIPDAGSGQIHGCVNKATGGVRVIDPSKSQKCITTNGFFAETPLTWNATGPQGLQGLQGLPGLPGAPGSNGTNGTNGATGPAGPAGSNGSSGFSSEAYIARNDNLVFMSGFNDTTMVTLDLPAGMYSVVAKTIAGNTDGDEQNVVCKLSTGESSFIPVQGGERTAFPVQDLLTLSSAGSVSLICNTWAGYGSQSKITAISVAALHG